MVPTFIAVGSNQGDSLQIVRKSMDRLATFSRQAPRKSSIWKTTPVDCPSGSPAFLNAVVCIEPFLDESPESLLARLQAIEREFGRQVRRIVNEPRPLDLDLIAFGDQVRSSPHLVLPHPRAHRRRFVLVPMAEIAPDFVLAGQAKTIAELLRDLQSGEQITKLDL